MTSVAAEQFHRERDPVMHYGPVWNKARKSGESFAACDTANESSSATLTTHLPWVTCSACKRIAAEQSRRDAREEVRDAATEAYWQAKQGEDYGSY